MFAHHAVRDGVGTAVTDRQGGISSAPYDALNLGDHVGDEPAAVAANRAVVAAALGVASDRLVVVRQVHGRAVHVATGPIAGDPPEADAIVTTERDLVLAVLAADCAPVRLWDAEGGVVGVAHVGRPGLAAEVLAATFAAMTTLGARAERTEADVGPVVCAEHYEVPLAMRDEVAAAAPGSATRTAAGRPALDLRAGIAGQLDRLGLRTWTVSGECTAESDRLYSHRRDGVTGRFAGLIWRAST